MKTSMDLKVVVENMSSSVGLTPLSCSLCETGEEVVNDVCTACSSGKYKNTTDDIPCKNCPSGWRSSTGNSLCTKVGETKTCWIVFCFFIILVEEFLFSDLVFLIFLTVYTGQIPSLNHVGDMQCMQRGAISRSNRTTVVPILPIGVRCEW